MVSLIVILVSPSEHHTSVKHTWGLHVWSVLHGWCTESALTHWRVHCVSWVLSVRSWQVLDTNCEEPTSLLVRTRMATAWQQKQQEPVVACPAERMIRSITGVEHVYMAYDDVSLQCRLLLLCHCLYLCFMCVPSLLRLALQFTASP